MLAGTDGCWPATTSSRDATASWFAERDILAVNLMSSPGAGKTTLLERTIRELSGELAVSVVEGDQETVFDAERIRATGCRVVQVNTGAGCHLDADMLARALRALDPPARSVVFVENVGNLVCPALFDLGEQRRVVIMSVTEGADKPLKYPHMFGTRGRGAAQQDRPVATSGLRRGHLRPVPWQGEPAGSR